MLVAVVCPWELAVGSSTNSCSTTFNCTYAYFRHFLHKVNSAHLLKTSSHASLYRPLLSLSRVERERKVKTENARCARVARKNANARKLKSIRIALLYAERLSLRDKRDASCWPLAVEIPDPGATPNVVNGGGRDSVDAPAALRRRVRTMPAFQLITMIIYFGRGASGSSRGGARGSAAGDGCLGDGSGASVAIVTLTVTEAASATSTMAPPVVPPSSRLC